MQDLRQFTTALITFYNYDFNPNLIQSVQFMLNFLRIRALATSARRPQGYSG